MADAEEKAKAEKLAAAKKRFEQLKKQKQKKSGVTKEDKNQSPAESADVEDISEFRKDSLLEEKVDETKDAREGAEKGVEGAILESSHQPYKQQQASSSVQSKMRSSSFRQSTIPGGAVSPKYGLSPEPDTVSDIYRKQATRIEDLEKENKRLAKEAGEGEKRWKKAEEELEDLREAEDASTRRETSVSSGVSSEIIEKLKAEVAALQRQNTQLQAQASRVTRHGSSPSVSTTAPVDYEATMASKSSTIESMEIEISNLKAQLDRVTVGVNEKEQITALEDRLARSERSAVTAQRELGDLKKHLERTSEKAVKEGSERISAEIKLRTLEREAEDAKSHGKELQDKVESLEKKVATLATLHKEHDARSQAQRREREKAENEVFELKSRLAGIESENLRLREEKERMRRQDTDYNDDGVDELENEERQRLEKKVRQLEGELHELRRGVWRERRKQFEGEESSGVTSPGAKFTDVDLGGMSPSRRKSFAQGGKGLGEFLTSGFNAITGGSSVTDGALLEDEDLDFDEDAFRLAQEEEAKRRIERIKEVKRALRDWNDWRLDLVENRKGGGEGTGEIFEV